MARTIGWVDPAEAKKTIKEQADQPAPVVSEEPKAEERPKKTTKRATKK